MPESGRFAPPLAQDFAQAASHLQRILFPDHRVKDSYKSPSPAVSDLTYRGLRHWGLAQVRMARLASKPPEPQVLSLLAIAWAALADELRPAHTVVNQAVAAIKLLAPGGLAQKWAGFVNAVLRNTLNNAQACQRDAEQPMAKWNAPGWWIEKIRNAYGQQAEAVLQGLVCRPPLTVRLSDRLLATSSDYQARLAEAGLTGTMVGPRAMVIEPPVQVQAIPGFLQGEVSVQDASAQWVSTVFTPVPPWDHPAESTASTQLPQILDACAAPGGKSIALAQSYAATVWAVDASEPRLDRLRRDLPRVEQTFKGRLEIRVADLLDDDACSKAGLPNAFDAIVLDAPCSASGVVRRHPEIPWKRSPSDIDRVVELQRQLLNRLWRRLKPGGELVFVTCSVFPEEGEDQQRQFLECTPDARSMPSPGRLLPCGADRAAQNHDGFFYAKFKKEV